MWQDSRKYQLVLLVSKKKIMIHNVVLCTYSRTGLSGSVEYSPKFVSRLSGNATKAGSTVTHFFLLSSPPCRGLPSPSPGGRASLPAGPRRAAESKLPRRRGDLVVAAAARAVVGAAGSDRPKNATNFS